MYALCKEYQTATFSTYDKGKSSLYFLNQLKYYRGLISPLPLFAILNLNKGIQRITKLSEQIILQQPWLSPDGQLWDKMSAYERMLKTFKNDKAMSLFQVAFEAIFATHPANISMFHTLFYIKSGKNFDTLMNMKKWGPARQHQWRRRKPLQ